MIVIGLRLQAEARASSLAMIIIEPRPTAVMIPATAGVMRIITSLSRGNASDNDHADRIITGIL